MTVYHESYGFRTSDLDEVAAEFIRRTGLPLDERDSGTLNGRYFSFLHDAEYNTVAIFRHRDRGIEEGEAGRREGRFYPKWVEFGVILECSAPRPLPYRDAIMSMNAFAPTLLEIFTYDDERNVAIKKQKWDPETRKLEDFPKQQE